MQVNFLAEIKDIKKENTGAIVNRPGSTIAKKTGTWRVEIPTVDFSKCNGCAICKRFCPDGCIEMVNRKSIIDYDYCKGCLICENVCPVKAITSKREEK